MKLALDTQPHLGRIDTNHPVIDGTRVKELAFELSTEKLDVLLHELVHAQSIMESVEN